jgi:hypothetical protein
MQKSEAEFVAVTGPNLITTQVHKCVKMGRVSKNHATGRPFVNNRAAPFTGFVAIYAVVSFNFWSFKVKNQVFCIVAPDLNRAGLHQCFIFAPVLAY